MTGWKGGKTEKETVNYLDRVALVPIHSSGGRCRLYGVNL